MLAGGYALLRAPEPPRVILVGVGAVMPEALAAAAELGAGGVAADVVCLTSPDLVFRAIQARRGLGEADDAILDRIFPPERRAPTVTLLDGHPHTLAFLSGFTGTPTACLGVDDFGQSGDVDDLYRHFGIDADTVVGAALDIVG